MATPSFFFENPFFPQWALRKNYCEKTTVPGYHTRTVDYCTCNFLDLNITRFYEVNQVTSYQPLITPVLYCTGQRGVLGDREIFAFLPDYLPVKIHRFLKKIDSVGSALVFSPARMYST